MCSYSARQESVVLMGQNEPKVVMMYVMIKYFFLFLFREASGKSSAARSEWEKAIASESMT